MRRLLLFACTCSMALLPAIASAADDEDRITIIHVQRAPESLARSLANSLEDEILISTDNEAGILMLRGSESSVKRASQLIQVLDQGFQIVNLNVTIAVSETDSNDGKLVDEFKLTTLDGNRAQVQLGQEVPVIQSYVASSRGGQPMARTNQVATGSIVSATPQVRNGMIAVALKVEKSWVEAPETDENGRVGMTPQFNANVDTTLLLKPGERESIRALTNGGADSGRIVVITVSASLGKQKEADASARLESLRRRNSYAEQSQQRPDSPTRSGFNSRNSRSGSASRSSSGSRGSEIGGTFGGARPSRPSSRDTESSAPESQYKRFAESMFNRIDANKNNRIDSNEMTGTASQVFERLDIEPRLYTREAFVKQMTDYFVKRRNQVSRDAADRTESQPAERRSDKSAGETEDENDAAESAEQKAAEQPEQSGTNAPAVEGSESDSAKS